MVFMTVAAFAPTALPFRHELCAAATSFDAAQAILRDRAVPLGAERIPLRRAGGRIIAEPVIARLDAPRWDCAAMDGFAVRSADLAHETRHFRIVNRSFAGGGAPAALDPGTTVAVATGAPVPAGAGRVLPNECVEVRGDHMTAAADPRDKPHIRRRASDFPAGDVLLRSGALIGPRALVAAAAADVGELNVWRRPRVNVIVNGDELASPGAASNDQRTIPDSLSHALLLMAQQWGAEAVNAVLVGDDFAAICAAAGRLLADCDILVIAGGASHGTRDFARAALETLGLETDFAGIAMKPGKPLWYGRIDRIHVLGLPGNPTAAMTTARLFLAPLIAAMTGRCIEEALQWVSLPSATSVDRAGSRDAFLCASLEGECVRIIGRQEASSQMTLALADMLVRRRIGAAPLALGGALDCLQF
jgi:molybdopterin molybdotransferase